MVNILKFVVARLREPSTYAGIAALAVALGHPGGAALIGKVGDIIGPILGAVAVGGGAVAVMLPDTPKSSAGQRDDVGGA